MFKKLRFSIIMIVLTVSCIQPTTVFASEHGLMDLFETAAFSGSWEVFAKFNWLGAVMQFIISAFSLIALFLICTQRVISLLYLSNRNLFDAIDDIKSVGKGQKMFGFGAMAKDIYNGNHGTGLDSIIGFGLSLLPNVRAYSDFAKDKMAYNLTDDDTALTYMLKVSLPTILLLFFFSIGFNGTLFKAYANVVDAMGIAASSVVDTSLSTYVDRALNTGSNYSFGYSAEGTEYGSLKQKMAKSIYSKILKNTTNLDTETKLGIGTKIDGWMQGSKGVIKAMESAFGDLTSKTESVVSNEAGNLAYSVLINGSSSKITTTYAGKNCEVVAAGSIFGLSNMDNAQYVHVIIQKKSNSSEVNYFDVQKKNSSGGDGTTDFDSGK